jgi:alpha-beta hydrolase superfamily lysophospholipase
MTERSTLPDQYEAVAMAAGSSAVFLRRSARPSRRAVLHVLDMSGTFAPADLARWYNERGFHFYVTDLGDAGASRSKRGLPDGFAGLDAACSHLRQSAGIDAIILSAQEASAQAAALWCDARGAGSPVDALILSTPDFGRSLGSGLDIACPVLVLAGTGRRNRRGRRDRHGSDAIRLGQHVTWLYMDAEPGQGNGSEVTPQRRRLFDEMGRWLGAYMYGQVRDQLL